MKLYNQIAIIIVLALFSLSSHGQTHDDLDSVVAPHSSLSLRVAPLSILDYYGAILPVGIEYRFRKRTSIIAEVGVPLFFYGMRSGITSRTKISSDVKFRTELRFYKKFSGPESSFWGLEAFSRSQTFFQQGSYFERAWGSRLETTHFATATNHKTISGGGFIWGTRKLIGNKFAQEIYIGCGLRYLTATHSNIASDTTHSRELEGFPGLEQNHMEGHTIKLYVPCGLKFSYFIGRN